MSVLKTFINCQSSKIFDEMKLDFIDDLYKNGLYKKDIYNCDLYKRYVYFKRNV